MHRPDSIYSVLRVWSCLSLLALGVAFVFGGGYRVQTVEAASPVTIFVEPQAGDSPVISLLNSAKKSIKLEVYELTDQDVFAALEAAKSRGVLVKVLLEEYPLDGETYARKAYLELNEDQIAVRWANEKVFRYTHEKSVDIDNKIAGIFTFNLSYSAFTENREFGVIDRNQADAKEIGAIFDADWSRSTPSIPRSDLVVSPVNARPKITALIDGAHHTLDLYEEEMDDQSIESHLESAAHRGVKVRLITSDSSDGVSAIRSHGVKVEFMSSPYVHAKAIVADGKRLFVGSENISSESLDENREMGILLSSSSLSKLVETTFQTDWKANR